MDVYVLAMDTGELISLHATEKAAQDAAQAISDKDAKHNKMPKEPLVWERIKGNKHRGTPPALLSRDGWMQVYPMPLILPVPEARP
jgi:hypothetical protein